VFAKDRNAAAASSAIGPRGTNATVSIPGSELAIGLSLLGILIFYKVLNILRCPFNMDEPQHLHVVWGWARGFVQYRDVTDNHMPLFQILFAPIFALIGDRATALYWMRFFVLPIYLAAAWCTYRIGSLLFSKRTGMWAVILAGFYPTYHFVSLEFRPDNLWAFFWLVSVLVLIRHPLNVRRAFIAGLLLGFAFGVSMKTVLLFFSILSAGIATLLLVGRLRSGLSRFDLALCVAAFFAGTLLVPGIIMISFALGGAWPEFRYWVFDHNILPHFRDRSPWLMFIFPISLPFLIWLASKMVRAAPDGRSAYRRCFVLLTCGFYVTALVSFWSLLTGQHFLPYHPLAFCFYSAALLALTDYLREHGLRRIRIFSRAPLPVYVAAIEFCVALAIHPVWIDGGRPQTDLLQSILKLTGPGDFVFDTKGQTVFRQRCFKPILETFTVERIRRGLMTDDVAQRCVETRACIAMPPRTPWLAAAQFIEKNYLPIGHQLCVAGAFLKPSSESNQRYDFQIVIPASYEIVAHGFPVGGLLDGAPYDGARFLGPGPHRFESQTASAEELAVLWAQAVDRNFTPLWTQ
jgi:Dolichyl-phosphate-mannose-protein mannosyltransferase